MSFYLYHKCQEKKGEFTVELEDPMTFPPGSNWKVAVVKVIGPGVYGTYSNHYWAADESYILCTDIVCNSYVNGKHVSLISNFQKEYDNKIKLTPFYVSVADQHVGQGINKIVFKVRNKDGSDLKQADEDEDYYEEEYVEIWLHFKSD